MIKRNHRTVRTLDARQLGTARGGALDAGFTLADDYLARINQQTPADWNEIKSLLVLPALT